MGKVNAIYGAYNRIFFKNRILVLFSILFPILFFIFFSLVFTNYEDVNKIPIGLVDYDQSKISEKVITRLHDNTAVKVVSEDYDDALKNLKSNRIEAIFVFKEGFEDNLKASTYEESIELIYLDKSTIGPTLGDIIASEIITDLSLYKSANTAKKYEAIYGLDDLFTKIESNAQAFVEENKFEMTIEAIVRSPQALLDEDLNIQKILKLNMTFGFTLVVFSFVILFANSHFIDTHANGVLKKLIASGCSAKELFIGQYLSIITCALVVIISQMLLLVIGLDYTTFKEILILFIILVVHVAFLANVIIILTMLIKDKTKYQSILAPLIFFFGLTGGAFWSVEFLSESIQWISYLSPFYWSLKVLNGTMLNDTSIPYIQILLTYGFFNIIISIFAVTLNNLHFRKLRSQT